MEILARLANLPGALPGACAQGLIWGIMAIGVYLTYRILDVADLTVDGSFGTGGAVCVMCLLSGMNVWARPFASPCWPVWPPALSPVCSTPLWASRPFWLVF